MVARVCELTGYAGVRYVWVTLPLVRELLDGEKYMLPGEVKAPDTERRRQRSPRAPSFRYLVRLARRCQSAEELGQQLRKRYDRRRQRQGLAPARDARVEAEVAERLDRLLVQD
jgi:hypothetical protein